MNLVFRARSEHDAAPRSRALCDQLELRRTNEREEGRREPRDCGPGEAGRGGRRSRPLCRFKANASRHAAMSYGYMAEEEKRLRARIEQLEEEARVRAEIDRGLAEMEETDTREDQKLGKAASGWTLGDDLRFKRQRLARIEKARAELEARVRAQAEAKVAGKTAKTAESVPEATAVKDNAQYNYTDPESRIMRNSEKAFIQGYNGQAAVDAESMIVVAADVTTSSSDNGALEGIVAQACANLGEAPTGVLADAGYCSDANVAALEAQGIDALIPPGRIPHAEWREQAAAEGAPAPDATRREAMRHKLGTAEGRRRYKRRQETVEPTFGNLKEIQGQRQELLRGTAKVRSMWRFQCAVYNLKKLLKAGVSNNGPMGRVASPMMA